MNKLNWCWSKVIMFRATRITCLCALLLTRTKAKLCFAYGTLAARTVFVVVMLSWS
jgi:hypothetical protein